MTAIQRHPLTHPLRRSVDAAVGAVVAVLVTALPASWALMVGIDLVGGSLSYRAAFPLGAFVGLIPLAVAAAMGRPQRPSPEPHRAGPVGSGPVLGWWSGPASIR